MFYLNNKNNLEDMEITLMRTPTEPLGEILHEWVDSIHIEWLEKSTIQITIPSVVNRLGRLEKNYLYDYVYDKTQLIKCKNPDKMFRIFDLKISSDYMKINEDDIPYEVKKITAYTREVNTLGKIELTEYDDLTYCLYKPENSETAREGLINMFLDKNPRWSIGNYTQKSIIEEVYDYVEKSINIGKLSLSNIQKDTLLWKYSGEIKVNSSLDYIDLEIEYNGISIKDSDGTQTIKLDNHINNVNKIHESIKTIEAYYSKQDNGTQSIKYKVITTDGLIMFYYDNFNYLETMSLTVNSIVLNYRNGKRESQQRVKLRNFDSGKYDWEQFLRQDISKAYNVFIEIDSLNRKINLYDLDEYGENKGICLKAGIYYNHVDKDLITENVVSKLTVTSNDCSIIEFNPNGTESIYNFNHFIENGHMTEKCKESWNRYNILINSLKDIIVELRKSQEELNTNYIKLKSKQTALEYNIKLLNTQLSAIVSQGGNKYEQDRITTELKDLQLELSKVINDLKTINNKIESNQIKIDNYKESLKFDKAKDDEGIIFTDDLLEELESYICECEVDDNTFVYGQDMYDYYYNLLRQKNSSCVNFKTTLVNFLNNIVIHPKLTWNYYLKEGDFLGIEENTELINNEKGLRIQSYDIIPNDKGNEIQNICLSNSDKNESDGTKGITNTIERLIIDTNKFRAYKKNNKNVLSEANKWNKYLDNNINNGTINMNNMSLLSE